MTQRQLEREVAAATGETVSMIHRIGVNLVDPDYPEPLVIDWDEVDTERLSIFPGQITRQHA
jgi:hypothetical protein